MANIESVRVKIFDGKFEPDNYIFEGEGAIMEMIKFFVRKYGYKPNGDD
jgi:hypothetical protein